MRLVLLALIGCGGHLAVNSDPTVLTASQRQRDDAAAPGVEALLHAYENVAPVLSPDGSHVLFRSDRGGSSELYLAETAHPEAAPQKLVPGPERVASAVFTADGTAVLFRRDTGADENFHIFRIAVDGSGLFDLTPDKAPLWRDSPLVRGGAMIYAARTATDYASKIIVQEGATTRIAYQDALPGTAIDASADGSHALFIREALAGGHELLEVDLASGAARMLAPRDGKPAEVTTGSYAPDGRIFVATDGGTEDHVVLALDPATLAILATYHQTNPTTAQVISIVPSPRGDRVAIMVDAGDVSTVRVLDAHSLAVVAEVKTPLGAATLGLGTEIRFRLGAGTFTADGAHFAIGLSTPEAPDEIFLADTATGVIAPLRHEPRPTLAQLPPITASIEHVTAFDGLAIPVNVYRPQRPGRLPVIVSFHGGPEASSPFEWSPTTRVLTSFGFVVLEPNIRGSTGFGRAYEQADDREKRADSLEDVASVNRWARTQPWCDPDRLIVEGGSYGGYVVLLALTRQQKLWRAGVDLAGIADLTEMMSGGAVPARYLTEFGDPKRDAALIAAWSPLRDAAKITAPIFIYQGQNDPRVPRAQADAMVRALRANHVPVEYMVPTNEGHTVARRDNQVEFLTRVIRFLSDLP